MPRARRPGNLSLAIDMNAPLRLHRLRSLRERIAALSVYKCRMDHERVVRADDSGLPVASRAGNGSYRRVGLCVPEQRAMRLGCSHTMARVLMVDTIRELESDGSRESVVRTLGEALTSLDNAIHLLDHQKGEAETMLAFALGAAHRDGAQGAGLEAVRKAESELQAMEDRHDDYVERIGRLRDSILHELDALIARSSDN